MATHSTLDNVNRADLTANDFLFTTETSPTVVSIVSSVATGAIHTGDKITFSVHMSAGVTVVGPDTPTLGLSENAQAVYDAAATSAQLDPTTLIFDYTVQPQDLTADLRVVGINTLTSSIQDSAGNTADLSLAGVSGADTHLAVNTLPTYIWNNGASGDWSTALDWSGAVVPDNTSNATIAGNGTETVTVSSNQATNTLTLSDANAILTIASSGTLTVNGGFRISTAQEIDLLGTLSVAGGAQTIDNTTINIGGLTSAPIPGFPSITAPGNLVVQQGTVATFGPNLTIDLAYGQINAFNSSALGFSLINHGTITADTRGGSGNVNTWAFDNEGTIAVSNGDTLTLTAQGTTFNSITGPSISPLSVNNGTISVGSDGHLTFSGYMGGSGSFVINDGGTLELSFGTLLNTVAFAAGAVGTLQLDVANGSNQFAGTLFGLSTGDVIDFANATVTQAIINGNTLTATLANGQTTNVSVAGSLPLGDSLQLKLDGKGGTDVVVADGPLPPTPTYTWNDGTSGDWSTASDWSAGVVPDGTSNATIAGTSTETVTVSGNEATNVLTLSDANTILAIANSTTLSVYGGLAISAAQEIDILGTFSVVGGAQTFDNTTIKIGSLKPAPIPGFPPIVASGILNAQSTAVIFGPNLTIDMAYGQINAANISASGFTLVNDGTITADTSGGSGNMSTWAFNNEGTIAVSNGDTLALSALGFNADPSIPSSANNGTISVGSGGRLNFSGFMGGSGSFIIGDGGTLELSGTLSNTVTFAAGAVGTLQLDGTLSGNPFIGTLSGLNTGDAIDFTGTIVTQAVINGNTLTATLANGQTTNLTVAGSLPVGDSLQLKLDGKGGTDVVVSDGPLPPPPTYTWNDGTSGDWSTGSDWSSGVVPDGTSNATIVGTGTETVTVSDNEATNDLTLSDPNAKLVIASFTSLSAYDGLAISAAQEVDILGTLSIGGAQTIDNTTIKIGALTTLPGFPDDPPTFTATGNLSVLPGAVVTFGTNLNVDLAYGSINASYSSANFLNFALINEGTITASTNGGSGNIFAFAFDNEGTVAVSNGDTLVLNAQGLQGAILTPSGFSGSPLSVNNGTMSVSSGGHLTLTGYMGGSGSFIIKDGGTLELSGAFSNAVTFASGGLGTLQIDGANFSSWFTGTISGFAVGETIDLAQVQFDGNGHVDLLAGNILRVTASNATYDLQLSPLDSFAGYFFHLSNDGRGNTLITEAMADTVVGNGETFTVPAGTTTHDVYVQSGGALNVEGTVLSDVSVASGGVETISSGGVATANSYAGDAGVVNLLAGGIAEHLLVDSGGTFNVAGTVLSNVMIYAGAVENVLSGGVISGTTGSGTKVSAGGTLNVLAGGSAAFVTVSSGGTADIAGTVTRNQAVLTGVWRSCRRAVSQPPYQTAAEEFVAGTGTGISGGTIQVLSGGELDHATVSSGGVLTVSSGGTASYLLVASGGLLNVAGVVTRNITISSGGVEIVSSGGVASGLAAPNGTGIFGGTVNVLSDGTMERVSMVSSGTLNVSAGATLHDATVSSGGHLNVAGTVTSNIAILSGGVETILSGGIATNATVGGTLIDGGTVNLLSGGALDHATISLDGVLTVSAGATAHDVIVANGGTLNNLGTTTSKVTVSGGGTLNVLAGGLEGGTTVVAAGLENVSAGGNTIGTLVRGGTLNIWSGGAASDTIVNSGGLEIVASGGTGSAVTIDGSGTLEIVSGAVVSDNINFTGDGGALKIDGGTMPTATISGFAAGDVIDLASVSFDSADTVAPLGGNIVEIAANKTTYDLQLNPSQVFLSEHFETCERRKRRYRANSGSDPADDKRRRSIGSGRQRHIDWRRWISQRDVGWNVERRDHK